MEEDILNLIKWGYKQNDIVADPDIITAHEIASYITKNYYKKDFTEWMFEKEYFYGELSEKYFSAITEIKFDSLEAVYEYWKENIKTQ